MWLKTAAWYNGCMENAPVSTEQINNAWSTSTPAEFPPFNPERAEKLQEIESVFWEQKKAFLDSIEEKISVGELPADLSMRETELWTTNANIVSSDELNQGESAEQIYKVIHDLNDNSIHRRHVINLPENILENPEYVFTMNHELAHCLEGHDEADINRNGLTRLFHGQSYLGKCINEGMTEHMAEIISGQKPNYATYEKDGIAGSYHIYYDFINYLCNNGVDFEYFVNAYIASNDAVITLRDEIAKAFPTKDGSHPLDNLARHSEAQIEYWLAKYTGHEKNAKEIRASLESSM